jgi:hypothetical protein
MPRAVNNPADDYRKRLLKTIPSEVLGAYLAANGLILSMAAPAWMLWIIFAICLAATPFWLYLYQDVRSVLQIVLSSIAFIIWAMTVNGPFNTIGGYQNYYGSVLLVLFSGLIAPLLAQLIKPAA